MANSGRDQTLALAGVLQAAHLVQRLARHGVAKSDAFISSIASILVTNAKTTQAIYDRVSGITLGLQLVRDKLGDRTKAEDVELMTYALALMQLAPRLIGDGELMRRIGQTIQAIKSQMESKEGINVNEEFPTSLISDLANLYRQTLNDLPPRVMVAGERVYLDNPVIADKMCAALLAGVRAAVLWHQLGGRRWHLLFRQRGYSLRARNILPGR